MIDLEVKAKSRTYPVRIGSWRDWDLRGLLDLESMGAWALVADKRVWEHWGQDLLSAFGSAGIDPAVLTLEAGEPMKSHDSVFQVYDFFLQHRLKRDGVVVVFGGGVLGDLVGFAAATYQRGVRYIQIPSTLLAMVDSAVGGKTGVNYRNHKNMIGAFHQPDAVLVAPEWLLSLPQREFRAGLAEVVKCGAIRDPQLLTLLEEADPQRLLRSTVLEEVIARALAVKAAVVGEDETDMGVRHILNYGHTFGHAIESATSFERFLHGEAVAIGMVAAAQLSTRTVGMDPEAAKRLEALLVRHGLPVRAPHVDAENLMELMTMDKKASAKGQRWVLTPEWGKATVSTQVPTEEVRRALTYVLES
ncbi:MAG: 3-dehydroquinate synthase [Candidatus Eisenbacteria bacterium]|uniref:3-dehydroquinate synthase n=1 Tax=Eiseniibacteriota bacterium TaxID=2212470 RepID=A0A956NAE1_UNCEI|nr:3-dehydroquinate synthase [Candidatus Eisenbacteria bacterium]MCB9462341.1 3-dehydroquinate synthase [Candidatus Eisenbacteria bacterium]